MLDEIQTGLGRTGKMFAFQHEEGIDPDVIIIGKALSGGLYPVSCAAAKREVLEVFNPGDHGSTFGGNPVAAAIGCAALDVLTEENLAEKSLELGNYFIAELKEHAAEPISKLILNSEIDLDQIQVEQHHAFRRRERKQKIAKAAKQGRLRKNNEDLSGR